MLRAFFPSSTFFSRHSHPPHNHTLLAHFIIHHDFQFNSTHIFRQRCQSHYITPAQSSRPRCYSRGLVIPPAAKVIAAATLYMHMDARSSFKSSIHCNYQTCGVKTYCHVVSIKSARRATSRCLIMPMPL